MPAIRAYKGNGAIIPVEVAKVSRAYRCPFTEEIFGTRAAYLKHLRNLRESRMHRRARQLVRLRKLQEFWNQPDFDSVVRWVELNPDFFWQTGKNRSWSSDARRWDSIRDQFWIRITYLDVSWSNSVSNSHNCPHNGVTNFGGRKTLPDGTPAPRGYPGWTGRIEFETSHDLPNFFSNILEGTRIYTGTGGGTSGNRWGYDVRFFAADWPGMAAQVTLDKLADRAPASYRTGTARYFRY